MAFKKERLEKILEREISSIIFKDVKNDRLKFVTITNVNLTSDLSLATVFYTILGNQDQIQATETDLLEAKGYIKSVLSKRLDIRKTPDLIFKRDMSYETGKKIEDILRNIEK